MVIAGGQAGRLADRAVNVHDLPTRPTHKMMVVVTDPRLVAGHGTSRFYPTDETRSSQHAEHVVDRLVRDRSEVLAGSRENRIGVGVRAFMQHGQHRNPGPSHSQSTLAQHPLQIWTARHDSSQPHFLEWIK
jgi:hypothetical protein